MTARSVDAVVADRGGAAWGKKRRKAKRKAKRGHRTFPGARDPFSFRTQYQINSRGWTTQSTNALNQTTTYGYDPAGNNTTITDALNRTWTIDFNDAGQAIKVTDPLLNSSQIVYNALGQVELYTDGVGRVTKQLYDVLGRPTVRTDGFGTALARNNTTGYNARGDVSSVADGLGQTTNFGYDDAGRWATSTDPLNHTWTTGYDLAGRATSSTDPLGKVTTFGYDDLGRQTSTTDANGNTTSRIFDAEGRVVAEFDGLGNLTEHVYDVAGREILTIAPDGGITQRSYDDRGLLLTLTDPVGNTTRWEYDALGRATKEIDPTGASKTFEYDSAGRMTRATDRLGRVKEFTYDNANRLTSEVWKASLGGAVVETLSYTWANDDKLLTATNGQGTYTLTYDELGRRKTIQDPHGITLTYGYSASDNVTSIADSRNGLVSNVFDAANRMTSTAQSGTGVTPLSVKFVYNNRNERTRLERYSDATLTTLIGSTDYAIDDGGRITGQTHKNGAGTTLVTFTNVFDTDNKITSETRNSVTKNFTYDTTDQVTSDSANNYSYDANGNRTMTGYTTGTANRTTSDGTWTYTYSFEGTLTKMSKGASQETWTYGYNHNNQMIWAEQRATDGGTLQKRLDYAYDVFGNMLSRSLTTGSTVTVKFAYDVQGASIGIDKHINPLWAELDNSGNITTRFLLGDREGEKLARSGSATHWLIHDRLGSLREVVDSTSAIVNTISYDAFGNILSETSSTLTGNFAWQGMMLLREEGMNAAKYRFTLRNGQWSAEDQIRFRAGDMNLRREMGNDPLNATDLSGLAVENEIWIAFYQIYRASGYSAPLAEKMTSQVVEIARLSGRITQETLDGANAQLRELRLAREARLAAARRARFIRAGRILGGGVLLEGIIALAGNHPPEGVGENACLVGEQVQLAVKIQIWKDGDTIYVVTQGARGTTITVDSPELRELERTVAELRALQPLIQQLKKDIEALQRAIGIMENDRTTLQQLEDIKKALDANPNGGKWVPPAGK